MGFKLLHSPNSSTVAFPLSNMFHFFSLISEIRHFKQHFSPPHLFVPNHYVLPLSHMMSISDNKTVPPPKLLMVNHIFETMCFPRWWFYFPKENWREYNSFNPFYLLARCVPHQQARAYKQHTSTRGISIVCKSCDAPISEFKTTTKVYMMVNDTNVSGRY